LLQESYNNIGCDDDDEVDSDDNMEYTEDAIDNMIFRIFRKIMKIYLEMISGEIFENE
jgi:hypothetical protein